MFYEQLSENPRFFFSVVVTVVVSICIHELAHGVAAIWRGDRTPIETGHMTPNPLVHMGLFSIIMLLVAGISWGMMPVDPTRMRGKYSEALVATAGPASNVLLALLGLVGLGLWDRWDPRQSSELPDHLANFRIFLFIFGLTNIHLAIFNLIPIPPLDGSRILANFSRPYARLMQSAGFAGMYLILAILALSVVSRYTSAASLELSQHLLALVRGY